MKSKYFNLIITFFFLFFGTSFSQTTENTENTEKKQLHLAENSVFHENLKENKPNSSLEFKFNALALVDDLSFPTFEFAVEKIIYKSYSVQLEAGLQAYKIVQHKVDTINIKNRGIRFRIEARYYFSLIKSNYVTKGKLKFFSGINFLYRRNSFNTNYQFSNQVNYYGTNTINDNIGVDKIVYGANILFGSKIYILENIYIEPVIYAGIINRHIKNTDRESPRLKDLEGKLFSNDYNKLEEASGKTSNLSFAFRIGISL